MANAQKKPKNLIEISNMTKIQPKNSLRVVVKKKPQPPTKPINSHIQI